jgi:hypothetical protein
MDSSLMSYLQWVELESFFSGYLLVYAIFYLVASNRPASNFVRMKILPNLPLAYAVVGTLYVGLELKNEYLNYHMGMPRDSQISFLKIWGLLSILFWIPILHKKPVFSLLHSFLFFALLMKSVYLQLFITYAGDQPTTNNIKIYTVSTLLNSIVAVLTTLASLLISGFNCRNNLHRPGTK